MKTGAIFRAVLIILMFQLSEGNRESVPRNREALIHVDYHSKQRNVKQKSKKSKSAKVEKVGKATKAPTASPSVSMRPSLDPTDLPSNLPSISMMPSLSPSQAPSKTPSAAPSSNPSSHPSKEPSSTPSYNPTATPSSYPSLSQMPSSTPSRAPSRMPSTTPSSKPSDNPTDNPSTLPSSTPSLTPSDEPSISKQPSTLPSSVPSMQPSLNPTSIPSISPSFSPSSQPSSNPTSQPSKIPSISPTQEPSTSPSSHPSISFWPSSEPSISSPPSMNMISGLKRIVTDDGEIGLQSGCPLPLNKTDVNYAEETAIRDIVPFVYSVNIINGFPLNDIITDVETRLNTKLFDSYVNCETTRRLNERDMRHLDVVNTTTDISGISRPIGVSSLPKDTQSDKMCSSTNVEETCVIIDGTVTFLFEADSYGFTDFAQQVDALTFIRNEIDSMGDMNGIADITYAGAIDDIQSNTDFTLIIPRVESAEKAKEGTKVSALGYALIAAACFLTVGAFLTLRKFKSRTYHRKEEILLSGFEDNYHKREVNVSTMQNGRQRLDSDTSAEDQDLTDNIDNEFRDILYNNKLQGLDDSMSLHEAIEFDINDFNAQHFRQQVHHCTSSICEVCRQEAAGKPVRFVTVDDEEDGIEVDLVGNTHMNTHNYDRILKSPGSLGSSRSYETPDTVEF